MRKFFILFDGLLPTFTTITHLKLMALSICLPNVRPTMLRGLNRAESPLLSGLETFAAFAFYLYILPTTPAAINYLIQFFGKYPVSISDGSYLKPNTKIATYHPQHTAIN